MSGSADSVDVVQLSDMSAEEKREEQALMRGKQLQHMLSKNIIYLPIILVHRAAQQEEVPPTGCGATACTGVLLVVSIFFLIATFPLSLLIFIKVCP